MRMQPLLRIASGTALAFALIVAGEVYPQRGGDRGGKSAGHKGASAPKQGGAGPAMTRPAGGPQASRDPAETGTRPRTLPRGGNDGPRPKVGGGLRRRRRQSGRFPAASTAPKTADRKPAGAWAGGDNRPAAKTADRRPTRPGGGASSDQLNDFSQRRGPSGNRPAATWHGRSTRHWQQRRSTRHW